MTARDVKQTAPAVRPSLRDPALCPGSPGTRASPCSPSRGRRKPLLWQLSCRRRAGLRGWSGPPALAEEIKAADAADAKAGRTPDDGTRYYEHWLSALEKLVAAKRLAEEAAIQVRKDEWAEAYRHTPHGQPVELRVGQEARRRK